ncbi:TadE-like protein [Haloactinopolyspora alba]|uniref:TadE-like protein n=1 Tax=Haloactinopolyspora alba TaxID=648780 RepID=A0A2P8E784_9ACTN|nr:TadE/TadG family type IV pilus assembly protein [Haloactinopolyspora alba]PSL05297.1 TadE-like protein [Haloactinopolyspora alba]
MSRRRTGAAAARDRGSATLELAILTPGLLLLLALLTYAGRHAIADGAVDQAAADAARAASLQRSPSAGEAAATDVARLSLRDQGLSCLDVLVDVDTSGFGAAGETGRVSVTVACPLKVADLPLTLPSITVSATAVSPVDTYRER